MATLYPDPQRFARRIDTLALECCTKLNKTRTKEFFNFVKRRQRDGETAPRKYAMRMTYYKGVRKGEPRDVFDIDGRRFNELWSVIAPYVYKSARRSVERFTEDTEDVVSEIRMQLFYILRFFGPTPNNKPLSVYIKLITNNVLTVQAKKRKIKTSYHTTSIDAPIGHDDEGNETTLGDILVGETPSFDILTSLNNDITPLVEAALGNDFNRTVASLGYTRKHARTMLQHML